MFCISVVDLHGFRGFVKFEIVCLLTRGGFCGLIGQVESGHTIVVHAAAGGVGSLMVQWASSIGATVIACVSNEEKGKQATADGAQHVIVYSDNNLVERVKEITKGVGVPVVYDSVGKDTFQV